MTKPTVRRVTVQHDGYVLNGDTEGHDVWRCSEDSNGTHALLPWPEHEALLAVMRAAADAHSQIPYCSGCSACNALDAYREVIGTQNTDEKCG
jgi:hypothetical protein